MQRHCFGFDTEEDFRDFQSHPSKHSAVSGGSVAGCTTASQHSVNKLFLNFCEETKVKSCQVLLQGVAGIL